MSRRIRIGYSHKSGTGHNSKKQRSCVLSSIPCYPSYYRNSFVDTHLPPPLVTDTASAMALSDQDLQPIVHMSESSRRKFRNADSVNSSPSSMTDINSNDDGVLYTSSARRLPANLNYIRNTELNSPLCSTCLSRITIHNTNYLHSASISRTDTNYNSNGVLSTSSSRITVSLFSKPNTQLNAASCSTILSLNKKNRIERASSAFTTLFYPRNKYELYQFRSFILTSATAIISNSSPTSLYNYKSLIKQYMNLVYSRLNESSIISPPVFTINKVIKLTVLSLHSKLLQEVQVASNRSGIRESTDAKEQF